MAKNKRRLTAPRPAQPDLMMFCAEPADICALGHLDEKERSLRTLEKLNELIESHNAFVKGVVGIEARRLEAARRLHSPTPPPVR